MNPKRLDPYVPPPRLGPGTDRKRDIDRQADELFDQMLKIAEKKMSDEKIHPGHRYGSENPELRVRLDAAKETQTPSLPRATPDASIPLARMLADELNNLHKGDYLAVEDRVNALLSTIDALPALSVADQIAIVICGAKETVAEDGPNRYLVLRSNWDTTAEFPQELVLDLNWLDKETGKQSGFLSDWGKLHPTVAALARATWTLLKEKQG